MSVMDKFLNIMKLESDDDGYYDNEDDYYDDEEPVTEQNTPVITPVKSPEPSGESEKVKRLPQRIAPMKQQAKKVGGNGMEVCVIKPTSVEDAREITETLLANRTVVLNLEGIDVDIAQRIIDFTSGSCYAIRGNLQKISHYIFIITPASVDISGDFQELFGGSINVNSLGE